VVLVRTSLRLNEAIGLCGKYISPGKIDGVKSRLIHDQLDRYALGGYHGYICFESQPALEAVRTAKAYVDRFDKRWEIGSVPRKPLKHRKKIAPEHFRYCPVHDAEAWNILVELWNRTADEFDAKLYGGNSEDYLLFDGLPKAMFYRDLTEALAKLGLRHRSPHKKRHTYLTWFYEKVGEDMFLANKVAGHRDRRDVERYNHLNELIGRERQAKIAGQSRLRLQTVPVVPTPPQMATVA